MANSKTERHEFSFEGGGKLTTIGATFFVSYLYHLHVDPTHQQWQSIKTQQGRISTINHSKEYHQAWLKHVCSMSDKKLNTNSLGLDGAEVQKMARSILQHI